MRPGPLMQRVTEPSTPPGSLSPHRSIVLEITMNGLIYLVGLRVVIMFILSFLGLH